MYCADRFKPSCLALSGVDSIGSLVLYWSIWRVFIRKIYECVKLYIQMDNKIGISIKQSLFLNNIDNKIVKYLFNCLIK